MKGKFRHKESGQKLKIQIQGKENQAQKYQTRARGLKKKVKCRILIYNSNPTNTWMGKELFKGSKLLILQIGLCTTSTSSISLFMLTHSPGRLPSFHRNKSSNTTFKIWRYLSSYSSLATDSLSVGISDLC